MSDSNWLTEYYNKLQVDYQISFSRRDNVTNWAYTLLAATLAIYFGFFSNNLSVAPFWRFSFISGMAIIMIRFLFQSLISYGYLQRVMYLRRQIERHWIDNNPSIDELRRYIKEYDHDRKMPPSKRNRFWDGEVRSGFIINIIIPVILISNELTIAVKPLTDIYYFILAAVIVYSVLEVINFLLYDQMRKK
jgi:hypothetical protein